MQSPKTVSEKRPSFVVDMASRATLPEKRSSFVVDIESPKTLPEKRPSFVVDIKSPKTLPEKRSSFLADIPAFRKSSTGLGEMSYPSLSAIPTVETIMDEDAETTDIIKLRWSQTPSELLDPTRVHKLHAVHLAVVFEDLADELQLMAKRVEAPVIELRSKGSVAIDEQFHRPRFFSYKPPATLEEERWLLKQNYESFLPRRIAQIERYRPLSSILNTNTLIQRRATMAKTDVGKCQADRTLLEDMANKVMTELIQKSTFNALTDLIESEKRKMANMHYKFKKAIQDKLDIKRLKKEIKDTKNSKKSELARLEGVKWELEDATQEVRTRCKFERLFISHTAAMLKRKNKKQCGRDERVQHDKIKTIKLTTTLEHKASFSMVSVIEAKTEEAEDLLEYWMEKYENDKEVLTNQLDKLKEERQRDLDRKEYLEYMTTQYKPIVLDARRINRKEEERRKRLELQNKTAIRIQAWWRGTMVRGAIGPFSAIHDKPKPEAKGKKDKKKKK